MLKDLLKYGVLAAGLALGSNSSAEIPKVEVGNFVVSGDEHRPADVSQATAPEEKKESATNTACNILNVQRGNEQHIGEILTSCFQGEAAECDKTCQDSVNQTYTKAFVGDNPFCPGGLTDTPTNYFLLFDPAKNFIACSLGEKVKETDANPPVIDPDGILCKSLGESGESCTLPDLTLGQPYQQMVFVSDEDGDKIKCGLSSEDLAGEKGLEIKDKTDGCSLEGIVYNNSLEGGKISPDNYNIKVIADSGKENGRTVKDFSLSVKEPAEAAPEVAAIVSGPEETQQEAILEGIEKGKEELKGDEYLAMLGMEETEVKPAEEIKPGLPVETEPKIYRFYSANPFITFKPGDKAASVSFNYQKSRLDRPTSGSKVRIDLEDLTLGAAYRYPLSETVLAPFVQAQALATRETGKLKYPGAGDGDIESNKLYVGGGAGLSYKGEIQAEISGAGLVLLNDSSRTTINLPGLGMFKSERSFDNDYRWVVEARIAYENIAAEILASHNRSTEEQANNLQTKNTGSNYDSVPAKSDLRDSHLAALLRGQLPGLDFPVYPIIGTELARYTFRTNDHGRDYEDFNLIVGADLNLLGNSLIVRPSATYLTQTGQVGGNLDLVIGQDKKVWLGAKYAPVEQTKRENQKVPVFSGSLGLNF